LRIEDLRGAEGLKLGEEGEGLAHKEITELDERRVADIRTCYA
jgi:hypothetical protein